MGAEELFEKDYTGELVRKRHAPERESLVAFLHDRTIEPKSAADDEAQVPPIASSLLDQRCERFTGGRAAFSIEDDDEPIGREAPRDRLTFPGDRPPRVPLG